MTKEDLIRNLGTLAKSRTSTFLEKIEKGGDLNLTHHFRTIMKKNRYGN